MSKIIHRDGMLLIQILLTAEFIEWAKQWVKQYPIPKPVTPEIIDSPPEPPLPTEAPANITNKTQVTNNIAVGETVVEDLTSHIPQSVQLLYHDYGITCTKAGPHHNVNNILTVFENFPELKDLVWYDEFHFKYLTRWKSKHVREWADVDDIDLARVLQKKLCFFRLTDDLVRKAVISYATKNARNEPRDWMESLEWDGTPRVHTFFHTHLGTIDSDYTRAVSKNFWVSMAARIYKPGCKVDNMVILEGKQGKFKSTALNIIGGKWYVESNENLNSKDFYQLFQGKLIVELGELDSFNKAEVTTIKKVVSTSTDRFRPPYGKAPRDFPRQCVFVGTTNENSYLRDHTGGRRFWPVRITDIDTSSITRDRDQLFAEAVKLFKSNELWHRVPDSALAEQEKRRESDPWEEAISMWLIGRNQASVSQIARECLDMPLERIDRRAQLRIGRILRVLKWEDSGTQRIEGRVVKLFKPTEPVQPKLENHSVIPEGTPNYAPQ